MTAAETSILESPRRRRRLTVGRVARASVPYLLILPVLVAVGAILGYPLPTASSGSPSSTTGCSS